jgi:hypothetical protein
MPGAAHQRWRRLLWRGAALLPAEPAAAAHRPAPPRAAPRAPQVMRNAEVARRAMAQLGKQRDLAACAEALVVAAVKMSDSHADNVSVVVVLLHDRPLMLPKSNSVLSRLRSYELASGSAAGGDSPTGSAFNSPRLPPIDQLQPVSHGSPAAGSPPRPVHQMSGMAAGHAGASPRER